MMRTTIVQALLVASLATLGASVSAQNATPREPTPGQAQPLTGTTQNGSPVGSTPSTEPGMNSQYNTQFNTNSPYPQSTPTMSQQWPDDQMKAYFDARQACTGQPLTQQAACNDAVNSRFSAIDAKCQKLSGAALAECLRGADHGD
jgi:hypothetical protein